MTNSGIKKPVVLVMAGHDPSGGAGIQADIEAIAANGCHAATVITCLTTQNTCEFKESITVSAENFLEQVSYIQNDMTISACKIGVIADLGILSGIEKILQGLGSIPVILDPVISAGTGQKINTEDIYSALHDKLMPFATVITPNSLEARELTGLDDLDKAAEELIRRGCQSVLITGAHEQTDAVINKYYRDRDKPVLFTWERLPGRYHGSGCTLSSAITAHLARGASLQQAVNAGQEYTWHT
ncbi:MAG TPA: hydroxymethylpyrimidine/phosphomethylpyrimidine kinase, partial [Gammaproteobacteria bacterium]|nr:hydroxymethylpyrimidine/phosphomethylpyrimidine kinase [Gammaproteobacteria bacterium]